MTIEEMRQIDAEKTYKELMWERSEVLRLTTTNLQLREGVEELKQRIKRLEDCAETAWGVIANVDNGSWGEQRADWREAAIRWRDDQFHPAFGLTKPKAKEAKP